MKLLLNLAQRRLTRALKRLRHSIHAKRLRHAFVPTAVLLAFALTGCSTQGLSKDEQAARRAGWRAAGLSVLNFGLNAAAAELNGDPGFRK